jgi:hypothetical protein
MYLEVLITACAAEQEIAAAYLASGRNKEIALYLLAVADTTLAFVKTLQPPESLVAVHDAFINWHSQTLNALARDIAGDHSNAGDEALGTAAVAFAAALAAFRANVALGKR